MPSAHAVAQYFLHLAAKAEESTPVTASQLHRLVYYAQGWCLATRERPLIDGPIHAGPQGPLAKDIVAAFSAGDRPVATSEAAVDGSLSGEDRGIIESVWLGYGQYSAWRLREMTMRERPWKDAREATSQATDDLPLIEPTVMRSFFRELHEVQCKRLGLDPIALEEGIRDARAGNTIPFEALRAEIARAAAKLPAGKVSPALDRPSRQAG